MSSRITDSRSTVRLVEFDLLEDDQVGSNPSPLSSPSPEGAWLEGPATARPRVLRGRAAVVAAGVDDYVLPALDTPYVPAEPSTEGITGPGPARRGAAAVAWAVGHRDGLEQGRSEGFALGHAEGLAAGTTAGHDRALLDGRAAADVALAALDSESRRTLDDLLATTEDIAAGAAELGFRIAELVLERELELSADPGAEAVRRAARLLPDTGAAELETLTARLHPDDLDRLTETPDDLVSGRSLQVVADPTVAPGGCVLESGATRVDATIPSALGRIRVALGLEPLAPELVGQGSRS